MATIEVELWMSLVKKFLVTGPGASLVKAEQQGLAAALQEWTAHCIEERLKSLFLDLSRSDLELLLRKETWQIHHRGKDFLGALRKQEVDVWVANAEAGLVLAADPKHFQSQDSLRKNWKNGMNDLVALATNLHERFPLCAVGGVLSFPIWAASQQDLAQIYNICMRSIPRERPTNALGKFEGFALAIYDEKGDLVWPYKGQSPLQPDAAFAALANALYTRSLGLL